MGNWIPNQELSDIELNDIKLLKENRDKRGNEGVLKMLALVEKKAIGIAINSNDEQQRLRAGGIAQFLDELSELINMK